MKKAPLTYYQIPFWLDWKLSPKSAKYNTPLVYRLAGDLDIEALESALTTFVNDYYPVGKHFFKEDLKGEVEQLVIDHLEVCLEKEELSSNLEEAVLKPLTSLMPITPITQTKPITQINHRVEKFIHRICQHPFNLIKAPLFKFALLKVYEQEYVLVLNFSHLITDGFTGFYVVQTLSLLYNHFAHHAPLPLRPSLSYLDYAQREEQIYPLSQRKLDLDFWQLFLENKLLTLHLPKSNNTNTNINVNTNFSSNDYDPSSTNDENTPLSTEPGSHYFSLSEDSLQAIKRIAKQDSTTPFIVLSALFAVLLYRYSQQTTFSIIYAVDTRPTGYKQTPGCFANHIPWLISVDASSTFRELLQRLTAQRKKAKCHQNCSLTDLIQNFKKTSKIQSENYFNVGMGEAFLSLEPLDFKDMKVLTENIPKQESFVDLYFAYQFSDSIQCRFDYRKDLFNLAFIEQMANSFNIILEYCLGNREASITQFCLLPPSEKHKILVDWNKTQKDYPRDMPIHQLFEQQVQESPNRVAILFENKPYTFEFINKEANQLGRAIQEKLKQSKVLYARQPIVAICLNRQPELIVTLLAILKAGACYLPLDPNDTEARRQLMLENAKVDVIITQKSFFKTIPSFNSFSSCNTIIQLDSDQNFIRSFSEDDLPWHSSTKDLAYIIYTSGTTGIPKGVMVEHKSLVNIILDFKEMFKFPYDPSHKVFNLTSFAFDVFALDLFYCLISGVCYLLCSQSVLKDPKKIAKMIESHSPTLVHATPTLWAMVLKYLKKPTKPLIAMSGGEALTLGIVKKLQKVSKEIWNFYGPTETTLYATFEKVETNEIPCIGKGFANVELYVLDEALNPVPIGVTGELYIGGPGLARGYLHDIELTENRFIKNNLLFGDNQVGDNQEDREKKENSRLYKTGDQVRWKSNGKLEYLGRKDTQLKIRGFRIELGEIETVLALHPKIAASIVMAEINEEQWDLIAYYVPKTLTFFQRCFDFSAQLTPETLSLYLKKRLPSYMQPKAFVQIETLFKTLTGKIDKSKLPRPKNTDFLAKRRSIRPYDIIELKLKAIWMDTLKIPSLGIQDDFFALGGHSMNAVLLITQINEQFKLHYPVVWVFEHKTVREQAKQIVKSREHRITYNPIVAYRYNTSQAKDDKLPLFFVHSALGGAEVYDELASLLPPDLPFYGIDSYNLNSGEPWCKSVEILAEKYIRYIKTVKPHGPYLLGGWSFGGLIAYEIARQLKEQGEEVKKIYLLDTCIFRQGIMEDLFEAANMEELLAVLPENWSNYLNELPKAYLNRVFACFRNDINMISQYALRTYEGPVLLIKSTRLVKLTRFLANYLHNGWKPWATNLEIKPIQADHFNLMEGNNLEEVARIIADVSQHEIFYRSVNLPRA
jgi:amino acid adenylation domain-containing protein